MNIKPLIAIICALQAAATALAADWQPLFNGKDLTGWKVLNGTAEYKVEDGAIVGISKTKTPNTFLATEKEYGDFILELEFKMDSDLNSGIQIRSLSLPEYNKGRVHGLQYEMDPSGRAWSGGLYDEAARGWLYPMTKNPDGQKAFKKDEWNKVRIEAIGPVVRTWLNGIPCANLLDNKRLKGLIALQVHGIGGNQKLDGKTIAWKNIRICTTDLDKEATPDDGKTPQVNAIDNYISDREMAEGWKLLWDGKTTDGWRGGKLTEFPKTGWTIKDGVLSVQKASGGESTNGGDIVTKKKYKNFELVVDFKITPGANSGIKYFVDTELNKGEGSSIGCEFQILDDEKHPDAKMGKDGNRTLGSLYDLITADKEKSKVFKKNEFNTAKVIVKGNDVEHLLNGKSIVKYTRNNQAWKDLVATSKYKNWPNFGELEEGNILLQDHGDEVHFKNIKIKELP